MTAGEHDRARPRRHAPVQGNRREPSGLARRPAGMTPGELARWSEANLPFRGSNRALSTCQERTPAFAAERRFEDRRSGTPSERAGGRPS